MLFVDSDNDLRIISVDGSGEQILSDSGTWSSLAQTPDGTKLAATTTFEDASLFILGLEDSEASRVVELTSLMAQTNIEIDVVLFAGVVDWARAVSFSYARPLTAFR